MNKLFALAAALVVSAVSASALAQDTKPAQPPVQPTAQPPATQPETKPEAKPETKPEAKPGEAKPADKKTEDRVYVQLSTSMGDIVIELDNIKAPISTENFLGYTEKGAYDGTIFHRVIKGFMVQGGGFDANMKEREKGKGIKNEWKNGLSNKRGTVAMARLGNQPDSGSNQFFINTKDNAFLDQPRDGAGYAVFGRVVAGMDVLDKIEGVKTTTKGFHGDVPVDAVTIKTAKRLSAEEAAKLTATPAEPTKK
ncbi:MAG: peptidylprolyl isomerase [Phycisphaerae bacterium]|nr:peptidylprolyl isomerase [Phycisphaerae bacterium]